MDAIGFPFPDNAPEPGACIRIEQPESGLVVLVLDPPHRSVAVLDGPLLRDLNSAIEEVASMTDVKGLVITGRQLGQYAVGADIDGIEKITDSKTFEEVVRAVHGTMRRLEGLRSITKVAAVSGPVPGGAYELSLCCDAIVASDDSATRIGLPEVLLGIIPGWGGCHRLPKRIGVPAALGAILTGRLFPAKKAWKMGMVDRIAKPEYLLEVAANLAMGREGIKRKKKTIMDRVMGLPPMLWMAKKKAKEQVMRQTRGHYPAAFEAIELVVNAPHTSMERATEKEAKAIGRLATGQICKNLIHVFKVSEEAKKIPKHIEGFRARKFECAGVLGAGVMGAGIASSLAGRGMQTRLMDLSQDAIDEAVFDHRNDTLKRLKRRRLTRSKADASIDRLDGTTELAGFNRCQIISEAVAEKMEVKKHVFGQLAEQCGADTILATNTSSLSVSEMAEGLSHPERVVGMHFFNPVKKMPLVEVVRGEKTSDEVVAEVAALALSLGKTPVVTKDVAGFLVNRILGPYLDEAVRLFLEGADPVRVDKLMLDFGMPMGPFALIDEVGFDIAVHAAEGLKEAYGERMTPSEGMTEMLTPERLGKKTGWGFYRHSAQVGEKKQKPVISTDLSKYQSGAAAKMLDDGQIVDRLVLSVVNEAARCMSEKVVETPSELDLATVFGTGFAPFRGGLLRYADSVGSNEIVRKLEEICQQPDVVAREGGVAKFTPAPFLRELAEENRGFHGSLPPSTMGD